MSFRDDKDATIARLEAEILALKETNQKLNGVFYNELTIDSIISKEDDKFELWFQTTGSFVKLGFLVGKEELNKFDITKK